ncbi:MAG TPA: polysaccharide biosynthesis/export family protein [Candidatus Acidoferrum sp.]|nr:polysaccharide biosynthesis/export family protein [Candidatus Acidoferrum sp.]
MLKQIVSAALFVITLTGFPEPVRSQDQPAQINNSKQTPVSAATSTDADHPQPHQRNPRYHIESGDILELSFRYTPEFDQEITVQPDGFVQLKGIPNDVHIQGLTVPEVIESLKKAYVNVLNDPVISVVLRDFEKPYFIAGGQVTKPGKYDLRGTTTATQAIAIAGGFSDFSKSSQVLLFRHYSDDLVEVKVLNLNRVLKDKTYREDLQLQPGDMLFVPKTFMAKIDRFLPRTSLGTYFSPAVL